MIPNKIYDVLKWFVMIVLPALSTAYVGLAAIWAWPLADEVAKTCSVVCISQIEKARRSSSTALSNWKTK